MMTFEDWKDETLWDENERQVQALRQRYGMPARSPPKGESEVEGDDWG
jgi:hypothetical protein